jgi:glucose/mannose transport system permease protein
LVRAPRQPLAGWFERYAGAIVVSPSLCIALVFVYGFVGITGYLSFTSSTLMPRYVFTGFDRYHDLFANPVWWESVVNLAEFALPFLAGSVAVGLLLAILMDQKIRAEGALRAIFLYPLALSQIVAGTAWQWILNPGYGIEKLVQGWGWTNFSFNWLADPDMAIFCIVIAALWQSAGFVAALFLAGLRSVDDEIVKAAQVDGASVPTIYWRVVLPAIRPVFFSVLTILTHLAIKTFDMVVAMTAGGPGTSTWLPSYFMYTFSFERGRMGIGAASAMMMLVMVVAVIAPLMYLESRTTRNAA